VLVWPSHVCDALCHPNVDSNVEAGPASFPLPHNRPVPRAEEALFPASAVAVALSFFQAPRSWIGEKTMADRNRFSSWLRIHVFMAVLLIWVLPARALPIPEFSSLRLQIEVQAGLNSSTSSTQTEGVTAGTLD